jgi:hypothetical protein
VLAGWKEHFKQHLNERFKSKQPTRPVDLRDDGVDKEKEGELKYMKNKKAAGADSIVMCCIKIQNDCSESF